MRLVKLLSKGEGIRTLLWTFVKSFQVGCWGQRGDSGERVLFLGGHQGAPHHPISTGLALRRAAHRHDLLHLRCHWHAGEGHVCVCVCVCVSVCVCEGHMRVWARVPQHTQLCVHHPLPNRPLGRWPCRTGPRSTATTTSRPSPRPCCCSSGGTGVL